MIHRFLDENPECVEKLALYGIERMREEGYSDNEIRDRFDHFRDAEHLDPLDIDDLLAR